MEMMQPTVCLGAIISHLSANEKHASTEERLAFSGKNTIIHIRKYVLSPWKQGGMEIPCFVDFHQRPWIFSGAFG